MTGPNRPNRLVFNEALLKDFVNGNLQPAIEEKIAKYLEARPELLQRIASKSGDGFLQKLRDVQQRSNSDSPAVLNVELVQAVAVVKKPFGEGLSIPSQLANCATYQVTKELGRGGMGVVYLAKNVQMDRLEVLKVLNERLLEHEGAKERFLREIRAVSKLNHPNIVTSYSILPLANLIVFVMEFVPGTDLHKFIHQNTSLPISLACSFAKQFAAGLQHAHEKGLVHRDVKPSNAIVYQSEQKWHLKILDFGLAKASSEKGLSSLTQDGTMLGTPEYMSPEQMLNASVADIRADIYSLGCTLYHMLAGRPPFVGTHGAVLLAHSQSEPTPLNLLRPDVPLELATVIGKMIAKNPAKRYRTPAEAGDALSAFIGNRSKVAIGSTSRSHELALNTIDALKSSECDTSIDSSTNGTSREASESQLRPLRQDQLSDSLQDSALTKRSDDSKSTPDKNRRPLRIWLVLGSMFSVSIIAVVWYARAILFEMPNKPAATAENLGSTKDESSTGVMAYDETSQPAAADAPSAAPKPPSFPYTPAQAKAYQSDYAKHLDVPITELNSLGMSMTLIPPGDFQMGFEESASSLAAALPYTNGSWFADAPKHPVKLTLGFRISTYEVTVGQFRRFVKEAGYNTDASADLRGRYGFDESDGFFKSNVKYNWENPGYVQTDEFPVTNVSWHDATKFCEWLSAEEQKQYRLPTEAQWEYACRGGANSRFSFGDDPEGLVWFANIADATIKSKYAHLKNTIRAKDDYETVAPVGKFQSNAFGLYDMHGNVFEWCYDGYRRYPHSEESDPSGPTSTADAKPLIRGGSWYYGAAFAMSARRGRILPTDRDSNLGFRIVSLIPSMTQSVVNENTALTDALLNYSWRYLDGLYPNNSANFRFKANGSWHGNWKYWITGTKEIRVHYDPSKDDPSTGTRLTFSDDLESFSGKFTDSNGRIHKISGTRQ